MGIFFKTASKIIVIIIGVFILLNVLALIAFMIKEGGGTTKNVEKQHKLILEYLQEKDPENDYIIVKKIEQLTAEESASYYSEYKNYVPVEKKRALRNGSQNDSMRYLVANKKYPEAVFGVVGNMQGAPLISFVPLIFQLDMLAETGYAFYLDYLIDASLSLRLSYYEKNGLPYWYQEENQSYPIEDSELKTKISQIAEDLYRHAETKIEILTISKLSEDYKKSTDSLLYGGFTFWVNEEPHYVLFSLKDGVEGVYQQLINGKYQRQGEAVIGGKEFFQENVNKPK